MFHPPGFAQKSVMTSLGALVYYTNDQDLWLAKVDRQTLQQRPTLVFLHGFGGGSSAYEWSKVYPAFAVDYQVFAPDLLGWGRSHHLQRSYQVGDYLVTLQEFLEQVCRPPTTVIASSLTAALLVRLAIAQPQLCRSLILITPSGLADFGNRYNNFLAQLVDFPLLDRLIYHTLIASATGIRLFLEHCQFARSQRVSQEIIDAYLASAQQPHAEYSALSFVRGDLCFDLAYFIRELSVPTAIAWGKKAQFTPYEIGLKLTEMNPRAIKIFQGLEDVGLTPQLELPAVTIALIQRCLKVQQVIF